MLSRLRILGLIWSIMLYNIYISIIIIWGLVKKLPTDLVWIPLESCLTRYPLLQSWESLLSSWLDDVQIQAGFAQKWQWPVCQWRLQSSVKTFRWSLKHILSPWDRGSCMKPILQVFFLVVNNFFDRESEEKFHMELEHKILCYY